MKKLLLLTIITFVLASVILAASQEQSCKSKNSSDDPQAKCEDAKATKTQYKQYLKDTGLDKVKKQHKELICQLKSIRDLAVKENATQTVNAIDEMIAKTQKQFHDRLKCAKEKYLKKDCTDEKAKSENCPYTAKPKPPCCPYAQKEKSLNTCPPDCVKSCCEAKIKAGTCPKLEGAKSCPSKCPKATEQKKDSACSKK